MSSPASLRRNEPIPSIEQRTKLFRGLADPSRLGILEALRDGPLVVGEIVAATGLTQPNASNHLRCLAECGLVTAERDGRYSRYRLSDSKIEGLLALADDLLTGPAQAIDECRNY